VFDLGHLSPEIRWRRPGGAGGPSPAFQTDFTSLSSLPTGLSFSRASNAMMFDSTGKLAYAPNNLLLQSNNFTDAVWTKDQTGTISATGIADPLGGTAASTFTAGASGGRLYQNAAGGLNNAQNGLSTVWLRRRTGTGQVSMYDSAAGPQPITLTGAWAQYLLVVAGGSVNGFAGIQLAVNGDAVDIYATTLSAVTYETTPRTADQVITTSAAYYGPRFDHAWNGSAWVAAGLLIEEQRTNNIKSSQAAGDANWNLFGGASVSLNNVVAPDGTTTGTTITFGTGVADQVYQLWTSAELATVTISGWAKSGTGHKFRLKLADAADNLSSDFTTTSTWQRFSFTFTTSTHVSVVGIFTDSGNNAGSFDIWGVQVEVGAFPTSYIPTTSAAVTRSADIMQLTGTALTTLQASAASILIENDTYAGSADFQYVLGFNPVGGPGITYLGATVGQWNGTANLSGDTSTRGTIDRVGLAFDGSGRSFVSHGGTVASDAGSPAGAAITVVNLGSNNAVNQLDGHFRSIAIYSSRLSDADLQTKSVVGAAF
jgi:hypothetical protein